MGRNRSRSRSMSSSSSGRGAHSSNWDGESGYRIHVSDLAAGVARKEVERVFLKFGPVNEVWVATNPPCFAFINYKHRSDAEKAIREIDGKIVGQSRVGVSWARSRTFGGRGRMSGGRGPPYSSSYRSSGGGGGGRRRSRSRSRSRSRGNGDRSRRRYSRSRSGSRDRRRSRRSPSPRDRKRSPRHSSGERERGDRRGDRSDRGAAGDAPPTASNNNNNRNHSSKSRSPGASPRAGSPRRGSRSPIKRSPTPRHDSPGADRRSRTRSRSRGSSIDDRGEQAAGSSGLGGQQDGNNYDTSVAAVGAE